MNETKNSELVVIGGGPGGYAAAFHAADLGLSVTLIDPAENPGGTCLYHGCIPTKAYLNINRILNETKHSSVMGIKIKEVSVDINEARSWKNSVVKKLTGGIGQLTKLRKIEYIRGYARFIDSHNIEISMSNGSTEKLSFRKSIIATGTESMTMPGMNIKSDRVMDSTTALELKDIPSKLLVIGAGYIGLEMATIYKGFGSDVSIVELTPAMMPGTDSDLVSTFMKYNKDLFTSVMLETKVIDLKEEKEGIRVTFEFKDGNKSEVIYDKILLSIGRKPNTSKIGLENTKVDLDKKGFVKVDIQRRTSDPDIFAIGDITGNPLLAHKATHEGIIAAEVISGKKSAYEPKVIPGVLFTDPEIAFCGLTEEQAKRDNIEVKVVKYPWAASGRALTLNRTEGLTKLIVDPKTEMILGIGIVGTEAGNLISEGALAIEMGALASDLALTVHPHPTLSETLMEAAELFYGHCTHMYKPQRK